MFQLRDQHAAAFRDSAIDRFQARMVRHCRQYVGPFVAKETDEAICNRVRESIPRARDYGLGTEQQVARFVDTTYLLGVDFDKSPRYVPLRDVLVSEYFDADERSYIVLRAAWQIASGREIGED